MEGIERNISKDLENPEPHHIVSGDMPIVAPDDDRLGYASFAKHLAASICRIPTHEGLVIAIYGPWGSGKTSLLNLVRHYIEQQPQTTRPMIVPFNPWWFSGHEDLTRRFFEQLQTQFRGRSRAIRRLRETFANLADIAGDVPLPYAASGKAAKDRSL